MTAAKQRRNPAAKRSGQKTQQKQRAKKTPTYSDEIIIAALKKQAGIVSMAAAAIGCERTTIWRRLKTSKVVADAHVEIQEVNLDRAEGKLAKAINDGNLTAVIFYLKTKGRNRGYSERVDVNANHKHEHKHSIEAASADLTAGLDSIIARERARVEAAEAEGGACTTH